MGIHWTFRHGFDDYELRFAQPGPPFDLEQESRLIDELSRAMPSLKLREYLEYKRSLLRESTYMVIAFHKSTDEAVAILAVDWYRDEEDAPKFLHLATMLIGEKYQGTTLLMHMLGFMFRCVYHLDHEFPATISMKTYNARSYSIMNMFTQLKALGVELYPSVTGEGSSAEIVDTAKRVAGVLSPGLEFHPDTGVITGGAGDVPADFWPTFPKCRDPRVNAYFQEHMTPHDRLLCVLSSPTEAARQRIMEIIGASQPQSTEAGEATKAMGAERAAK